MKAERRSFGRLHREAQLGVAGLPQKAWLPSKYGCGLKMGPKMEPKFGAPGALTLTHTIANCLPKRQTLCCVAFCPKKEGWNGTKLRGFPVVYLRIASLQIVPTILFLGVEPEGQCGLNVKSEDYASKLVYVPYTKVPFWAPLSHTHLSRNTTYTKVVHPIQGKEGRVPHSQL